MRNCIVAQSGGPTAVINASAMGLLKANNKNHYYDNVYAGINGIQGILEEDLLNLSEIDSDTIERMIYTPASGLGSCRYKLKSYEENKEEYIKLFEILEKNHIETFFYIGGNDSMDTVHKLSCYAKEHELPIKFFGIPKTIDNDLPCMDHTPGYGSAAKFIATAALENKLDCSVYTTKNVVIIETMGRDTGWLAASAAVASLNGEPIVDLIYLPESHFSKEKFLKDVAAVLKRKSSVVIVVSEGIKTNESDFMYEVSLGNEDTFGHVQLGGVSEQLKNLIQNSGVCKKVRSIELSTMQRCAMHTASLLDINEAERCGYEALNYSLTGNSGDMMAIQRISDSPYKVEIKPVSTENVANSIRYFPKEWINAEENNVTKEAVEYVLPLIQGEPKLQYENGLPNYAVIK